MFQWTQITTGAPGGGAKKVVDSKKWAKSLREVSGYGEAHRVLEGLSHLSAACSVLTGTCGSVLGSIICGSGKALRSCFWPQTSSPILGSIRISLPMTTMMTSC